MPVLIDFGGVKQVEVTAVSKFTNLGKLHTRLGKKGYAPEEQWRQAGSLPNDLYALAVTALVLLTGKEPQELYDSKGISCNGKLALARNWKQCCRKCW